MTMTNTSPQPVVHLRGLTKRYGPDTVVDGLDLDVQRGECFGLLGPNGAGKTTTLRLLLGHTPPTSGSIEVLGYPIPQEARTMRARVGVVPQQDNLDPDFTVVENLRTYASYFGLYGAAVDTRVIELLELAALTSKANAGVQQLSGGMRRRLTLVRALVNRPDLVILDEPTTGLDPQARQLIWQRLRSLLATGVTLILTTHYMEEAARLCDRLAILDHGRVLVIGSPRELIAAHIEPRVVEVHGPGVEQWRLAHGRHLASRTEQIGETVFCYTDDDRALLADLTARPELWFLHRPASLEDVFLKLTGRELHEETAG
ncbi:Nod factor export ATP-binding protein I [Gammaproteobacteria bacterium]